MSGSSQRGAVLVIALLLLVMLTLLAVTGMRTAIAELWMAGNEQFHRQAVDAASAGAEVAIARMRVSRDVTDIRPVAVGSPPSPSASYAATVRYKGREASLPGSSAEKLLGQHFEITSTGTAPRGAREVQVQGVMVVSSPGGVQTFQRVGEGLAAGGVP